MLRCSPRGLSALARAPLLTLLLLPAMVTVGAEGDLLETPSAISIRFGGRIGVRIERGIDGWLIPAPAANPGMTGMFRMRDRTPPPALVPWAGEFAGKFLLAAAGTLRESDRADLRRSAAAFVDDLLAGQDEDGYLGPFPRAERLLGNWDLWGHYHVIEGLLLWSDLAGDARALAAARRAADLACLVYLDGGRRPIDAGSPEMNLAIAHVLGVLHRRTGEERYLRLLREVERDWERAGDYFRQGLAGVEFHRTPRPRWESLHDLQALAELRRISGDERYGTALINLWSSIRRLDRHPTGGFSTGEQATGNPYAPGAIETCAVTAWAALTADVLRLTADPSVADELELTALNAVLGAQHPSGRWWTYSTPVDGVREASAHSIVFQARAGTPELNCCSVNGPRGLALLAEWAVMVSPEGPVVSWYGPMHAALQLSGGPRVVIEEETDYPVHPSVRVVVRAERPAVFTLRLRVPAWSARTVARGPDGPLEARPGSWLAVRREWRDGDRVDLDLDLRLRAWVGDRQAAGKAALYRGPLLLAWDQAWSLADEGSLPAVDLEAAAGTCPALERTAEGLLAPWVLLTLPGADGRPLRVVDFASAGAAGTRYRSWLPVANAPPPSVLLERPRAGETMAPGKALVTWRCGRPGRGVESYTVSVQPSGGEPGWSVEARRPAAVVEGLVPGRWVLRVTARNRWGTSTSEERTFTVDAAVPPVAGGAVPLLDPGPGGIVVDDPLRGEPRPSRGLLLDVTGASPAPGPGGETGGAVALDGTAGRIRYSLSPFPERDWTIALRVAPASFPDGRIAQVASAWAAGLDDPLRLVIEGGKLFARIEAGGRSFSTGGVPLTVGAWVHVTAVKSGPRLVLYVNGEERASAAVPEELQTASEVLALGANPLFPGNEFLAARFAGLAFWTRALAAEEVQALARK